MEPGFVSFFSLVVVMSAINAVWGQQSWLISNPWGHEPLVRTPVQQQQQAAYPQRAPFQAGYPQRPAAYPPPPQHWHTAHTNQHSAGVGPAPGVGTAAGAPGTGAAGSGGAPATTAAIPAEVEPLEVEGPTTTTPPPTQAPYRYPPAWNQQPSNRYPPPPGPRAWAPPNWRATQGGQTSNQYQTRPNQNSGYPNQQPQSAVAVPAPSAGGQYQPTAGSPNTKSGQKSNDLYRALAGVIVQSLERKNLLPKSPPDRPPPAVTTAKPPLSSPSAEPVETEVPTTTIPPPTTRRSLPAWVQQQQPRPPTPARTQGAQESQRAWANDWLTKQINLQGQNASEAQKTQLLLQLQQRLQEQQTQQQQQQQKMPTVYQQQFQQSAVRPQAGASDAQKLQLLMQLRKQVALGSPLTIQQVAQLSQNSQLSQADAQRLKVLLEQRQRLQQQQQQQPALPPVLQASSVALQTVIAGLSPATKARLESLTPEHRARVMQTLSSKAVQQELQQKQQQEAARKQELQRQQELYREAQLKQQQLMDQVNKQVDLVLQQALAQQQVAQPNPTTSQQSSPYRDWPVGPTPQVPAAANVQPTNPSMNQQSWPSGKAGGSQSAQSLVPAWAPTAHQAASSWLGSPSSQSQPAPAANSLQQVLPSQPQPLTLHGHSMGSAPNTLQQPQAPPNPPPLPQNRYYSPAPPATPRPAPQWPMPAQYQQPPSISHWPQPGQTRPPPSTTTTPRPLLVWTEPAPSWMSQGVMGMMTYPTSTSGTITTIPGAVQPQPSVPVPNVPHPPQGHYDYHPPMQAAVPPQAPAASGSPMSRYDVFSSQFDSQAFHAAREQARVTTPDPMKVLSQALGALGMGGGSGSGTGTGSGSGAQWGSSFSQPAAPAPGAPRTSPRPPTTTPDFQVAVNPYRQGGFYLAPTDLKARPKPTTQIIETHQSIPADGVTAFNPFEGFLGNTPPPEKKPTTPLPGKNGDHFAGFLGFHEATTASPRSDVNAVNPKYAQYFAPVPVDNGPAQNTASGTSSSWTGSGSGTNSQQSASAVLSQLSPTQLAQALCQISPNLCAGQGGSAPAGRR